MCYKYEFSCTYVFGFAELHVYEALSHLIKIEEIHAKAYSKFSGLLLCIRKGMKGRFHFRSFADVY